LSGRIGRQERFMNKPVVAGAIVIVVGGLGLWYYLESGTSATSGAGTPGDAPSAASAAIDRTGPAIAHPLPAAQGSGEPPPSLEQSDAELQKVLPAAIGASAVRNYLEPDSIIRRMVVTIDNIPRQKIPVGRRPVRRVGGQFRADGDELHATLDPASYARYQPYVTVVHDLDVAALMKIYVRFYPLLQRAYEDLGYPKGYFNDRLVEAIDVLLAAPQIAGPIDLVRPNVMYEYADPAIEALPAGQKLMIRLGPDNATVVKAKLTELRAALTASPPH
jgi:hypothetical protein